MTNLSLYRGDTKNYNLTLTDSNSSPIDLTGATVYFTVKSIQDDDALDAAALISKDVTSHTDAANGQTTVALTAVDMDIAPGKYVYDIQYKNASNDVKTIVAGTFTVSADVTRRS